MLRLMFDQHLQDPCTEVHSVFDLLGAEPKHTACAVPLDAFSLGHLSVLKVQLFLCSLLDSLIELHKENIGKVE